MLGCHFRFEIGEIDGGYCGVFRIDEFPEMTEIIALKEGETKETFSKFWGGKTKVCKPHLYTLKTSSNRARPLFQMTYKCTGDNTFKTCCETEKYGKMTWTECYTEDGVTFEWCSPDKGVTFKEFYCREVCETGWFRYCKGEGQDAYMKATGINMPVDWSSLRQGIKKCGDTW